MKRMLLVFAHPDDESFSCAGIVAKYAKAGWHVDLICATRGEAGNSGQYNIPSGEALGLLRQKELEKAGTLLGINSITFLGYIDGTLADENPGELEDKIYQKMEELVPDCVITFDTTGISNHPDHIKVCFATTYAFQKYAFWIKQQLGALKDFDPEKEPKLYYACVPESLVRYLIQKKVFPAESFGKPWRGTPDKFVTTVINTKAYAATKKKALKCHKTQQDDVDRFFLIPSNPLTNQEYFILRMHGQTEVFMGKEDRVSPKL